MLANLLAKVIFCFESNKSLAKNIGTNFFILSVVILFLEKLKITKKH